jgi:diacylglycerol kinase (ATP)
MLPGMRTGNHLSHPMVQTLRAREIRVDGNTWPAYADGEPQGTVPVTATCVPDALTVLA